MLTSKPFPGFDALFHWKDPLSRRAFRGGMEMDYDDILLKRGEIRPTSPIVVRWEMGGRTLRDVVWTTDGISIISEKVIRLFKEARLTGWTTFAVRLHSKSDSPGDKWV